MVQILLDHGADPNHTKANGHVTPLVLAAMGGHLDCVRKLLVRGASTKAVQTTKELPAGNDREEDDEEDDEEEEDAVPIGATALSLAVARGHEDVAALLQMHDEMSKCEL
jgi:ankyrin repeat protein